MTFYNFSGNVPVEFGDTERGQTRYLWSRVFGVAIGSWFIGIVRGKSVQP